MILALRAAAAWSVRPTKFLTKWSARDRALAKGLVAYEASLNQHGIPWDRAIDPERVFQMDEVMDLSAAAYEEHVESIQKSGNKVAPGQRFVVVDQGLRRGGS